MKSVILILAIVQLFFATIQAEYFAFTDVQGSEFVIQINDTKKIEHARDLISGKTSQEPHLMGRLKKRPVVYNPKWSFFLEPDSIQFFEVAIEVCDSSMQYVEDHLDEACGAFLPGCMWCPWTSKVVREVKN